MAGKNIKEQKNTQIVSSRTLPNNVEAEKNLLGCILVDSERTLEVVSSLCEDDFYAPSHKKIFSAMKQTLQNNKNIEFVTVLDVLERENTLSQAGGIDYLATVNSCVLSAVNFQVYVDIIVRCATMRKLIHACSDIVEEAYTSDNRLNMLAEAEKKIYDIGRNDVKGDITLLGENVNKVFEKID
ncbi:MAG: DnaB-like helicase N-terminal domain-containing protein, partial [Clostridia bacterium]